MLPAKFAGFAFFTEFAVEEEIEVS